LRTPISPACFTSLSDTASAAAACATASMSCASKTHSSASSGGVPGRARSRAMAPMFQAGTGCSTSRMLISAS
jgi:hypothetical protein